MEQQTQRNWGKTGFRGKGRACSVWLLKDGSDPLLTLRNVNRKVIFFGDKGQVLLPSRSEEKSWKQTRFSSHLSKLHQGSATTKAKGRPYLIHFYLQISCKFFNFVLDLANRWELTCEWINNSSIAWQEKITWHTYSVHCTPSGISMKNTSHSLLTYIYCASQWNSILWISEIYELVYG